MDNTKSKIIEAKKLFKERGFEKIQDLAEVMELLPNTLTSNLKYIIKNERFETGFAKKLFETIGVSKEEFISTINQFRAGVNHSPSKVFEIRSEILNRLADTYQSEIINIIDNLSSGDTYTLVTTEQPWEFKNAYLQKIILNALKRGVTFKYIYPLITPKTIELLEKHEDGFAWEGLKTFHNRYLEKMLRESKEEKEHKEFMKMPEYKANPRHFIEGSLKAFFDDDIALVHPRLKTILITRGVENENDHEVLAFSEVTFADTYLNKNNKPCSLWYPLPNNDVVLLNKLIHNITIK